MSQALSTDDRATEFAFILSGRFPEVRATALDISDEPDAELTRVEWEDWSALTPQSEAAARQLRTMTSLMPHLRGFVSPMLPIWELLETPAHGGDAWVVARRPGGSSAEGGVDRGSES